MKPVPILRLIRWLLTLVTLAGSAISIASETITVQLKWRHQFQFAGYYAAVEQGYYREEGLNVRLVEGNKDLSPLQQVLSGQADYGIGDADILVSRISGKPVVALAAIFQHSPGVLLSLKQNNIQTPEDLIGKRVMLSSNGQGVYQFKAMLLKQHLDIRQMTIVPHTWRLQDLIEGKVDVVSAYAMDEPGQLQQMGYEPSVISNQPYGVDFYGDVLFTSEQEISEHPERVQAFWRATKKGWMYAFKHQGEMADLIAGMPGVTKRGLDKQTLLHEASVMLPYVLTDLVPLGHMNEERWNSIAQTLADMGLVPQHYRLQGFLYQDDMLIKRPYMAWLVCSISVLLLVLAATFVWNMQIRRKVIHRTQALQNEIDRRTQAEYLLKVAGSVAKIGGWVIDLKTNLIHWSDEVAALHDMPPGYSPTVEEGMSMFVPESQPIMASALKACMEAGVPYDLELEKITATGRRFWVRAMGQPVHDNDGNIIKLQGSLQDITTHKQLAAIKEGQDRIQAMMLADISLSEILHTAVLLIEHQFPDACCAILLLDQEGSHLRHTASTRLPAAYAQAIDRIQLGSCGIAALTEGRVVAEDISEHPLWDQCYELASMHGLRACWSMPVLSRSRRVLGVLAMYRQQRHVPRLAELDFVDSYAQILGLAIEREQSDEQLHLLQSGVSRLNDIVMITEAPMHAPMQQKIVFLNEAFARITGVPVKQLQGISPFELFQEATPGRELERIKSAFLHMQPIKTEVVAINQEGVGISLEMDALPLHDKGGRVTHWVAVLRDITERKQADAQIRQLAYYDTMTGLPNRLLLQDKLSSHVRKAMRKQVGGALLFIDIDNFKTLNDTYGHDVGDALLVEVAKRIRQSVRRLDTVSRLGGDEFVVVLDSLHYDPAQAEKQARRVCEKIMAAFKKPFKLKHYQHYTTPSIGVVLFDPEHLSQTDELLRRADLAMYKAKEAGRNGFRFFDTQMETELRQRVALEADLHAAIEKQEFTLHFQPQYNQAHEIVGAEALLRWQHPEHGLIMPGQFISLAESSGQIGELGHWVLKEACKMLQRWSTHPQLRHLVLSVNVSPKQYLQPAFVAEIQQMLVETGISPQRLKLELTESMLVDNVEDIIAKMAALREVGICFSLDDFGTGYSSLSYLKRFPFDQLKIDQSFVRDMLNGHDHESIVNAIISLGQSLQLEILAEGVETEAQLNVLKDLGCEIFQGYYFTKPLPLDMFESYASQHSEAQNTLQVI
ncbi:EAL domain-containing protein [Methylophilus sp.]|uniref:EAL domain-containing protein n=1 Tax=Methylophilus sp. TaxID=29541 RepID=UPI000D427B7E|nr:EAL domain-containing protein [Methylophilus sp.]PPD12682.1 MAG: diguanylate cyclase [Methylophilus sp.]